MLMCIENLVRFCQFVLKILSGNQILTSIKGRNSIKNWRKMMGNNPKLYLVNVDVHTKLVKFCQFILNRQATFSNLTYLELYTSLQECFDKLVIYHEIRNDLFICNYMIVKE